MRFTRSTRLVSAANLLTAMWIPAVFAQTQQEFDWCVNKDNQYARDLQINGCTASIQSSSGRDARAYNNRGVAYKAKGDLNRAIADYNQAIALDPKYAVAYYNRGVMYNDKGDLDRAIADYNRAIALDPKYIRLQQPLLCV
jgi:tetratricopeptide (TPR) repeat protein